VTLRYLFPLLAYLVLAFLFLCPFLANAQRSRKPRAFSGPKVRRIR
jgi:hypothetical protein